MSGANRVPTCIFWDFVGEMDYISADKDWGGLPLSGIVTIPKDLPWPSQIFLCLCAEFSIELLAQLNYYFTFVLPPPHLLNFNISLIPSWDPECTSGYSPRMTSNFLGVFSCQFQACLIVTAWVYFVLDETDTEKFKYKFLIVWSPVSLRELSKHYFHVPMILNLVFLVNETIQTNRSSCL